MADVNRMQFRLLGQALLAQACLLAEAADVGAEFLLDFADSCHAPKKP
jgi:hypothetical protein